MACSNNSLTRVPGGKTSYFILSLASLLHYCRSMAKKTALESLCSRLPKTIGQCTAISTSQLPHPDWVLELGVCSPQPGRYLSQSEQPQMSIQDSCSPRAYGMNSVHWEHRTCWVPACIDYNLDCSPSREGDKHNCHQSLPFAFPISLVSGSYLSPRESCTARNTKSRKASYAPGT